MALEQSLAQLSLATVASPENGKALPTKSLIFKPKTAKTATPIPLFVFALQDTTTPSNLIAKSAGVKEPRLAKDDLVEEFFKTTTKEVSIANLSKELAGKIKIVIDDNVLKAAKNEELLKLSTQSSAAVLSAKTVVEFLQSTGIEIIEVDFQLNQLKLQLQHLQVVVVLLLPLKRKRKMMLN